VSDEIGRPVQVVCVCGADAAAALDLRALWTLRTQAAAASGAAVDNPCCLAVCIARDLEPTAVAAITLPPADTADAISTEFGPVWIQATPSAARTEGGHEADEVDRALVRQDDRLLWVRWAGGMGISSTRIREAVVAGDAAALSELCGAGVAAYVLEKGLYRRTAQLP
jgi:hypothetical protein